jgi:opacity protein-like surface antigen
MKNILFYKVAAETATFLCLLLVVFHSPVAWSQKSAPSKKPAIVTPQTSKELIETKPTQQKTSSNIFLKEEEQTANAEDNPSDKDDSEASAPTGRSLHAQSFMLGLGQTFLMGNYSKHGEDKIAMDLFYTYAASYSFDLMVNAHWSKHEDKNEFMEVKALAASVRARLWEYDNFSPYVLGGLGFYIPEARRGSGAGTQETDSKITFGMNFGAGAELRLNSIWSVGALFQMHWPFRSKQDDQSDLRGYYSKLLLTIGYSF